MYFNALKANGFRYKAETVTPPDYTNSQKSYIKSATNADAFGYSLNIDEVNNTNMVIGAYRTSSLVGAIYTYVINDDYSMSQKYKILSPSTSKNWFGYSTGMDNGWIAAGAPYDGDGAVYMYKMQSDGTISSTPTQKLIPDDVNMNNNIGTLFGFSIAMKKNIIVIGYIGYNGNYGGIGVYKLVNDSWVAVPCENNYTNQIKYGFSVCTDGTNIVVGGINATSSASLGLGGAAILKYDGDSTITLIKELTEPDVTTSNNYGFSVAISSNGDILVGSPNSPNSSGCAYLYDISGNYVSKISVGTSGTTIIDSKSTTSDKFGEYVKFGDSDVMFISAIGYSSSYGTIYVLQKINDVWQQAPGITDGKLQPSVATRSFGSCIDVNNKNVIASAYVSGEVFLFN